jgi:hypothetical protein
MGIIKTFISAALTDEAVKTIANTVGIEFDNRILHHATLGYNPSEEQYALITKNDTLVEGTRIIVTCRSCVSSHDMGVQAIIVDLHFEDGSEVYCTNAHPHITVSTKEGVKPFKSNSMLAQYKIGDSGSFTTERMNIKVDAYFHEGH